MSALKIRRRLRRHRRRTATILAVIAIAGLIVAHHSVLQMNMHHYGAMGAVAEMCLGVFTAVGAALIGVGAAVFVLGRRRPLLAPMKTAAPSAPRVPGARARHGPGAVAVLCVNQR